MLLMASKVPACAELVRGAVQQQGMCVVIGLQSTGEANMNAVRRPPKQMVTSS
jgi:C-terminal processing protease CtpA/Prc